MIGVFILDNIALCFFDFIFVAGFLTYSESLSTSVWAKKGCQFHTGDDVEADLL